MRDRWPGHDDVRNRRTWILQLFQYGCSLDNFGWYGKWRYCNHADHGR